MMADDSIKPLRNNYDERALYDKNGNITQLVRNGEHDDTTLELTIDILNYTYHPTLKNQLRKEFIEKLRKCLLTLRNFLLNLNL
jgi:hypothetical protein